MTGSQEVAELTRSTWPVSDVAKEPDLDLTVPIVEGLTAEHAAVLFLGVAHLYDRSDRRVEPLYVDGDPAGHPLCMFVPPERY